MRSNLFLAVLMGMMIAGCGRKASAPAQPAPRAVRAPLARPLQAAAADLPMPTNRPPAMTTLPAGALVRGRALREDGTPLATFQLTGEPLERYALPHGTGTVNATITPGADGTYSCAAFLPNFYRMQASCEQAPPIRTNLLVDVEGAMLDLTFRAPRLRTINGKVLVERTLESVANALVRWHDGPPCATTDVAGAFVLRVPDVEDFSGGLSASHAGYADARCYLIDSYSGQELTLFLHDAGHIAGTIRDEAGAPVAGVEVIVNVVRPPNRKYASVSLGRNSGFWTEQEHGVSAPSDAQGAYIISNAAAPQTYWLAVKGSLFGLMDPAPYVAAIRTHVGEVCRCDLVVRHTPRVLVKFQDQQQVPVRAYTLNIEAFNEKTGQGNIGALAAAADADGWYCVPDDFMQNRTVLRAVQAFSTASLMAETNNVPLTSARTNFIVLTGVLYTNGITVCGYLYDCNGEPVIDTLLDESTDQQSFGDTRTDHLGFFEFADASGPTGGLVCLSAYTQDTIYRTNVVVSTTPIVWQLPPLRTVRGRVCLERADTPATNFAAGLGLDSQYACNDDDGRFVLPTRENAGVVYAWVGNYAPVQAAFRLDASGQCDVGDLIVRAAASTLRGRVVNERAQPLVADVSLLRAGRRGEQLDAQSDAQAGRYEFTCLPTGAYQVVACKSGQPGAARSAWIALDAHAVVELPDLVLQMTNAALVRLIFVMEDGTPAAYMHTSLINATTDEMGAIEDYVRLGQYNDVRLTFDSWKQYSTEPFTITAATRELRVTVRAAPLR